MNATDVLSHEHRAIELVLNAMEKFAEHLDSGDADLDPSIARDCLDFAAGFADRCHHAKEETLLFPLLEERGIPKEGGPIGVMLHDHDQGRELIRRIRAALDRWTSGDESARADLAQALKCYAILLRSHIMKEDQVLFVAAESVLTEQDNERLIHGFEEIEEEKIGPGVHEQYHAMLDDLERRCEKL